MVVKNHLHSSSDVQPSRDGHSRSVNLWPEVGKVTLKHNGNEALNDEFLLKSNGDEALNDVFL